DDSPQKSDWGGDMRNPSNSACRESISRLGFLCVNPFSQVGGEDLLVGFRTRLALRSRALRFWPAGIGRLADTQKQEEQSCKTFRVSYFHKAITNQFRTSLSRRDSDFPRQRQV